MSRSATPSNRPNRSRRGWPSGWRPGVWPSTRRRQDRAPIAGFDFLGFTVRRYNGKLLIKPSKAAIKRIRERLRTEMRALRGSNAKAVIAELNPIVKGWAAYYRGAVSKKTFSTLDDYLWELTYKWAVYSHANKPKRWVVARYFGKFNKFRNDHWVFGDAASGAYLARFAWTNIVRHIMVTGGASPDDPALASIGPNGARRSNPQWTATRCACSPGRTAAALSADLHYWPPISHRSLPRVGTMVAAGHPQGNYGGLPRPSRETRLTGR